MESMTLSTPPPAALTAPEAARARTNRRSSRRRGKAVRDIGNSGEVTAGNVAIGQIVLINGRPCKVVQRTSSKTGKHGSAKTHLVVWDEENHRRVEILQPSTATIALQQQQEEEVHEDYDEGELQEAEEKVEEQPQEKKVEAKKVGVIAKKESKRVPVEQFHRLIQLQHVMGFWVLSEEMWENMGLGSVEVTQFIKNHASLDEKLLGTVLVIQYLEAFCKERRGEWNMIEWKARQYLSQNFQQLFIVEKLSAECSRFLQKTTLLF
jgi:hypothetical protein